jgi:small subunit ribosomal protein S6
LQFWAFHVTIAVLVKGWLQATFPLQAVLPAPAGAPAAIPRKGGVTMPEYELTFIVQPEMEEEPLTALVEKITETIGDIEGQVHQVEPWGKRRLAYAIEKHREGLYFLMHLELPSSAVRSLERSLKLMEDVIRHLLVRKDETATK